MRDFAWASVKLFAPAAGAPGLFALVFAMAGMLGWGFAAGAAFCAIASWPSAVRGSQNYLLIMANASSIGEGSIALTRRFERVGRRATAAARFGVDLRAVEVLDDLIRQTLDRLHGLERCDFSAAVRSISLPSSMTRSGAVLRTRTLH